MHRLSLLLVCALISLPGQGQTPANPPVAELEALIVKSMQDWKVPGASVAIVRGDQPLLVKGFGYRDLEGKKPTTEKPCFGLPPSPSPSPRLALPRW